MMDSRRCGFTPVELLMGVLIIGLLARAAAWSYNADTNRWPPDVNRGIVTPELEPYLGEGFSFGKGHHRLDWGNLSMPDGIPRYPETGLLIGVAMTTSYERLGQALIELVGERPATYSIEEHYTFILAAG